MLRRRLQQLSCVVNTVTFSLLVSLLLAHILLRRYLPNVAHGKENFDFFFEGEQEGDDQHHPPFVIDWRVVLGTILAFLVSCAVDVGGLAGGGLLVPIFYQVVGLGLKASTGLSQAAIAGASAAALAANLFRAQLSLPNDSSTYSTPQPHASTDVPAGQHADCRAGSHAAIAAMHGSPQQEPGLHTGQAQQQQQPLVDLDLVLLLTPGLLLGVAVGAVMNDLLPEWVICTAVVGVLFLSCQKIAVRGLLTWHAEAQAEASLAAAAAISSGPQPRLRPILTGAGSPRDPPSSNGSSRAGHSPMHGSEGSSSPQYGGPSSMFQQEEQFSAAAAEARDTEAPAAAAFGAAAEAGGAEAPAATASSGFAAAAGGTAACSDAAAAAGGTASPRAVASAAGNPSNSTMVDASVDCPTAQPVPPAAAPSEAAAAAGGVAVEPTASGPDSSSSSPSHGQLQHKRSSPIYECTTTPLPPAGQRIVPAAAAVAGGRAGSKLARTGLYPGWFSPPLSEDTASSEPTAAWYPYSRSSSATGINYVITDNRLPAWRQQHGSSGPAAAAAAAAAMQQLQQQLQQLWLWVPHVHLQRVPWMKLVSLWALWLGFMGLTALSGLLPVCSWAYVTYLLLFVGITGCVTAVMIQVLLVEPLLGAKQVCLLSEKLQQLVHKHRYAGDIEAQQHSTLQQPLLQHDYGQQHECLEHRREQGLTVLAQCAAPFQQQEQQQGASAQHREGHVPSAATSLRLVLVRAGRSARSWLHVLTGFGRPAAAADIQQGSGGGEQEGLGGRHGQQEQQQQGQPDQQQQREEGSADTQQAGIQQQAQTLSLFTQMRLQQMQQHGPWGGFQPSLQLPVLPPIGPVAAATDSYFFPATCTATISTAAAAAGGRGQGQVGSGLPSWCSPPIRVLAPAADGTAAAAAAGSSKQGLDSMWAGFKRAVQGQRAVQPELTEAFDPFDGNEQPWRDEEPFPVAAAVVSPCPAPSLAAAAAAAAHSSGSSGSSALVTIAAAAAVVSVAAGVLSAVTGVASSALFMPILLDFRVHTQVAMASTVVLVFLSSSAATLSFILQGRLIGTYALLFCVVGLCGGCVGVSVVGALLRLAKRPSVVVLVLAGALAVAGVSCSVSGVQGFMLAWEAGKLGFRALCQQ